MKFFVNVGHFEGERASAYVVCFGSENAEADTQKVIALRDAMKLVVTGGGVSEIFPSFPGFSGPVCLGLLSHIQPSLVYAWADVLNMPVEELESHLSCAVDVGEMLEREYLGEEPFNTYDTAHRSEFLREANNNYAERCPSSLLDRSKNVVGFTYCLMSPALHERVARRDMYLTMPEKPYSNPQNEEISDDNLRALVGSMEPSLSFTNCDNLSSLTLGVSWIDNKHAYLDMVRFVACFIETCFLNPGILEGMSSCNDILGISFMSDIPSKQRVKFIGDVEALMDSGVFSYEPEA